MKGFCTRFSPWVRLFYFRSTFLGLGIFLVGCTEHNRESPTYRDETLFGHRKITHHITWADSSRAGTTTDTLDIWARVFPFVSENYVSAEFRMLWLTEKQDPSGFLIVTPGFNADGRTVIGDTAWQEFAFDANLALVGVRFQGPLEHWSYHFAHEGSGEALLEFLDLVSNRTIVRQAYAKPLLLWGFSAGGIFSYYFAAFRPENVLGYCAIKGGFFQVSEHTPPRAVPGLLFTGTLDVAERRESVYQFFYDLRADSAFVALADEPESRHEIANANDLAWPFLLDCLRQQPVVETRDVLQITRFKPEQGWLGNIVTRNITAYGSFIGDKSNAAWFPIQQLAQNWQNFVSPSEKRRKRQNSPVLPVSQPPSN